MVEQGAAVQTLLLSFPPRGESHSELSRGRLIASFLVLFCWLRLREGLKVLRLSARCIWGAFDVSQLQPHTVYQLVRIFRVWRVPLLGI